MTRRCPLPRYLFGVRGLGRLRQWAVCSWCVLLGAGAAGAQESGAFFSFDAAYGYGVGRTGPPFVGRPANEADALLLSFTAGYARSERLGFGVEFAYTAFSNPAEATFPVSLVGDFAVLRRVPAFRQNLALGYAVDFGAVANRDGPRAALRLGYQADFGRVALRPQLGIAMQRILRPYVIDIGNGRGLGGEAEHRLWFVTAGLALVL